MSKKVEVISASLRDGVEKGVEPKKDEAKKEPLFTPFEPWGPRAPKFRRLG